MADLGRPWNHRLVEDLGGGPVRTGPVRLIHASLTRSVVVRVACGVFWLRGVIVDSGRSFQPPSLKRFYNPSLGAVVFSHEFLGSTLGSGAASWW